MPGITITNNLHEKYPFNPCSESATKKRKKTLNFQASWTAIRNQFIVFSTGPRSKQLKLLLLLLLSRFSHVRLCDPIDGSPPGSPVPGILQARTLEWVAISFSSAWKWKVKVKLLSCVWLSATPWTAAYQAPLSMGYSRQEYWSGVLLPSPITPY